jgi:hypothetical protein
VGAPGAGKVWGNPPGKTCHCLGAKPYGTAKHGEYMTEAQAGPEATMPAMAGHLSTNFALRSQVHVLKEKASHVG